MSDERRTSDTSRTWGGLTGVLLVVILILAAGLRLWGLDARGLWQDEIFTAAIASAENSLSEVVSIPLYNTALPAPPLYFILTHALLRLGDNDFLLRFPALVFGVLGVAATYALGARLWGKREGAVGALLLAAAPLHLRYSQDARFYTLQVLLSLLSVYFLYRAIFAREREWKWFAGFVVCTVLNLYNHLFAFFVLGAEIAFVAGLWIARGEGKRRRILLDRSRVLAFVISLAIIALAYTPMVPHLWRGLSGSKGLEGIGGAGLAPSLVVQALDSWGLGSGWRVLVLFVPFAGGTIAAARSERVQLWLACCWILIPFVALVVLPAGHNFRPRYVLFMLPLYLLFVARGLTAMVSLVGQRWAGGRRRLEIAGLVILLAYIGAATVSAVQAYYEEDRADWRGVAALVAARISPGDVVVSPGPFSQVVMPRYEESLAEETFLIAGSEVFLSGGSAQEGGVWFVGPARDKMGAIGDELSEALGFFFKVVFEVNDESAARGRELKIAPVMYDDLWVIYVQQGLNGQGVARLYEDVLTSVPPSAAFSVHLALGDFHREAGQLDQAAVHYEKAAVLKARAPEPHYGLALVYEAEGRGDEYAREWQIYEELQATQ
jgi:mannosyltransferase